MTPANVVVLLLPPAASVAEPSCTAAAVLLDASDPTVSAWLLRFNTGVPRALRVAAGVPAFGSPATSRTVLEPAPLPMMRLPATAVTPAVLFRSSWPLLTVVVPVYVL